MSLRIFQYFTVVIFVVALGFSGCRAGQPQAGVARPIFGGGQMVQRVGNIAVNRAINAGISSVVRGF